MIRQAIAHVLIVLGLLLLCSVAILCGVLG